MKIVAVSDMHGYLPPIPECDVLVIAGDMSTYGNETLKFQYDWLCNEMLHWLNEAPAKHKLFIAGNHDWYYYTLTLERDLKRFWREDPLFHAAANLNDEDYDVGEELFYGFPWIPNLKHYAFYLPEREMRAKLALIPDDTTVLITHCPPQIDGQDHEHQGNILLNERIKELSELKLIICGHAHGSYGVYDLNGIAVVNCCIKDRIGTPMNKPQIIYL